LVPADSDDQPEFDDDDNPILEGYGTSTDVDDDSISTFYDHDLPIVDDTHVTNNGKTFVVSTPGRTIQIATEDKFVVVKFSDLFAETGCARILRDVVRWGFSAGYMLLCDCRHIRKLTDRTTSGVLDVRKAGIPAISLDSHTKLKKAWEDANQTLWSKEYAIHGSLFACDPQVHDTPLLCVRQQERVLNYTHLDSAFFDENELESEFNEPSAKFDGPMSSEEALFMKNFLEAHCDLETKATEIWERIHTDGFDSDEESWPIEECRMLACDPYGANAVVSLKGSATGSSE
jgi:hypothetical protein